MEMTPSPEPLKDKTICLFCEDYESQYFREEGNCVAGGKEHCEVYYKTDVLCAVLLLKQKLKQKLIESRDSACFEIGSKEEGYVFAIDHVLDEIDECFSDVAGEVTIGNSSLPRKRSEFESLHPHMHPHKVSSKPMQFLQTENETVKDKIPTTSRVGDRRHKGTRPESTILKSKPAGVADARRSTVLTPSAGDKAHRCNDRCRHTITPRTGDAMCKRVKK